MMESFDGFHFTVGKVDSRNCTVQYECFRITASTSVYVGRWSDCRCSDPIVRSILQHARVSANRRAVAASCRQTLFVHYSCSHECYNVNGTTKKEVLNLYPKGCFHSRSGVLHRKHSAAQWFKNYNIRENLCTHFSSPNWHLHSDTLAGTSSIERRHLLHVIAPGKREQWESVAERNAGTHGVLTDRHDDWGWWVPLAWVMGKDDEWILRPPCAYPQDWKIVVFWFFFLSSRNCRTVSLSFELLANDGYSFASRSVLSKYIIIDLMRKVHPILIKPI